MTDAPSDSAVAFMKQSFRDPRVDEMRKDAAFDALYQEVLKGIVRNVKTKPGGFLATSGVVLPYYLNLSTNFMDPVNAPRIVELVSKMLLMLHAEVAASPTDKVAVIGMEVAGGMMVSQLVAAANPELNAKFDFVYMRKQKKSTGTAQQLEGLKMFTERTKDSPPMRGVWIDDVNSTGSSLTGGVETLEEDYNILVGAALYVVDRSKDREALAADRMYLARDRYTSGKTKIYALMDLAEVDPLVPRE